MYIYTVHVHNTYVVYMYNVLYTMRKLCTNCISCTCVIPSYLQYTYSVNAILAKYYDCTTVVKYYNLTTKLNTTKYDRVYDHTTITKRKRFFGTYYT